MYEKNTNRVKYCLSSNHHLIPVLCNLVNIYLWVTFGISSFRSRCCFLTILVLQVILFRLVGGFFAFQPTFCCLWRVFGILKKSCVICSLEKIRGNWGTAWGLLLYNLVLQSFMINKGARERCEPNQITTLARIYLITYFTLIWGFFGCSLTKIAMRHNSSQKNPLK